MTVWWTPRLDRVDRAILAHLEEFGPYRPLRIRDLVDIKATRRLRRDDVIARIEILLAAGLIQRADYFLLAEQAAGRTDDATDQLGTVVVSEAPSPEASPPAESAEAA